MFKDLPEGKTHSFGDGCVPAHTAPQPPEYEEFETQSFLIFDKASGSRFLDEAKIKDWLRENFVAKSVIRQTVEEIPKGACSSGLCGHSNLYPNSVDHGEYIGMKKAADLLSKLLNE